MDRWSEFKAGGVRLSILRILLSHVPALIGYYVSANLMRAKTGLLLTITNHMLLSSFEGFGK